MNNHLSGLLAHRELDNNSFESNEQAYTLL